MKDHYLRVGPGARMEWVPQGAPLKKVARLEAAERRAAAWAAKQAAVQEAEWQWAAQREAEERVVAGVVPPIWEPGVLEGTADGVGHYCAGQQVAAARRSRRRRGAKREQSHRVSPAPRPSSAMGVGQPVPTAWEKCGRCAGLPELVVAGLRVVDVPASELDLRQWPVLPRPETAWTAWTAWTALPARPMPPGVPRLRWSTARQAAVGAGVWVAEE